MIAPSQEHVRSVYSGRQCLGYVAVIGDGFQAELIGGSVVGLFATMREAATAIMYAGGRPADPGGSSGPEKRNPGSTDIERGANRKAKIRIKSPKKNTKSEAEAQAVAAAIGGSP